MFPGDGDEADSNSMQLLKPCGLDDPIEWKPGFQFERRQIRTHRMRFKMKCSK